MRGRGWALYFLAGLVTVACLADFLARDRPLLVIDGADWSIPRDDGTRWAYGGATDSERWELWPPVPHDAGRVELGARGYQPPGALGPNGKRHWLGTDGLGRDTAAGLITGTRTAVLIGLGSLLVTLLLGLPLGALAGYFGDDRLRVPIRQLIAGAIGGTLALLYFTASLKHLAMGTVPRIATLLLTIAVAVTACWLLLGLFGRRQWLDRFVSLPVDRVVLFLLEALTSVPKLILLIGLVSLSARSTFWSLTLIIGLLGWTPVARFLRGELLRIRELPYIAAARVSGIAELRILWRHALPNALAPVGVVAAFIVGGSILTEAMLSFLGLGLGVEAVSWGSLLEQSRKQPTAWWLAVFPGLLLTTTVLACNSLRRSVGG